MKKQLLYSAAIVAALSGVVAAPLSPAFAQASSPPPAAAPSHPGPAKWHAQRFIAAHVDARIAFLKAALKITPAQEAQFEKVAQAMHENATEMEKNFQHFRGMRDQHRTAVEQLETRVDMAQHRAQMTERYLTAFKPLYASLSPEQKQIADQMMTPHRFARFGHFGHHRG